MAPVDFNSSILSSSGNSHDEEHHEPSGHKQVAGQPGVSLVCRPSRGRQGDCCAGCGRLRTDGVNRQSDLAQRAYQSEPAIPTPSYRRTLLLVMAMVNSLPVMGRNKNSPDAGWLSRLYWRTNWYEAGLTSRTSAPEVLSWSQNNLRPSGHRSRRRGPASHHARHGRSMQCCACRQVTARQPGSSRPRRQH